MMNYSYCKLPQTNAFLYYVIPESASAKKRNAA